LQLVFVEDWYFATHGIPDAADIFLPVEITGDVPIQTVPDGPTYPNNEKWCLETSIAVAFLTTDEAVTSGTGV
jgi:hypothetical protein